MFDLFQYGKAAIHYAAKGGHLEIIALLIKNGADGNVKEICVRKISQMFCHNSIFFLNDVRLERKVNMAWIIYDTYSQVFEQPLQIVGS